MIMRFPKCFDQYVEIAKTEGIQVLHWVVRVATTPPDALAELREWDNTQFKYDGEHAIEFIED